MEDNELIEKLLEKIDNLEDDQIRSVCEEGSKIRWKGSLTKNGEFPELDNTIHAIRDKVRKGELKSEKEVFIYRIFFDSVRGSNWSLFLFEGKNFLYGDPQERT